MIYSVQQIKYEILAHIKEFGGEFSGWYIGIASDPMTVLREHHHVDQVNDIWLFKQALTFNACRTVQQYFLHRLQLDGESVTVGAEDMNCVYVFKKSTNTQPEANS